MQYLKLVFPPTTREGKPGFLLSDRELKQFDTREELPDVVSVGTLSALVELSKVGVNGTESDTRLAVQVVDHSVVKLMGLDSDEFGRRDVHVVAKLPAVDGFKFGQWYDHESFLISVMSNFTDAGDREYLLRIASNLTNENVSTSEDDGVTQKVGLKKGAVLKTTETIRQRVNLAPFRTFREVTQPASEFVFRVRQAADEVPALALFEADGGKWRIDAAQAVRDWFTGKLDDEISVVA